MKPLRRALFLVFAMLCFTGGVLADRALVGSDEVEATSGSVEEQEQPARRNVVRPNLLLPVAGMLFNQEKSRPLSRARAEELFAMALETSNFQKRAELLTQVSAGIGDDFLREALDWSQEIPLGQDRSFFMADLLRRLARQDLAAALEYAGGLQQAGPRESALIDVVSEWMRHDVDAALAWVREQPNDQVRSRSLQSAIWQISATDPARAAELAGELDPLQGDLQMGTIYRQWAALEPEVAAEESGRLPPGQGRMLAQNSVAAAWAERDIDAALAWIKSLEPGHQNDTMLSAAIISYGTRQKDPRRALELAMQEGSPRVARSVLSGVSYQLAGEDLEETLEWVQTLSDEGLRDQAVQTLGWNLSNQDPQRAVELADRLSSGTARSSYVVSTVSQWSRRDPQKAAAYVEGMPEGELRTSAIDGLVANWAYNDPQKAAEFAERNCRGEQMGRVAGVLVSNWAYKDPEAAADWLGRNVSDVQPYAAGSLISSWLASGREGSREKVESWVDSLPTGDVRDNAVLTLGGTMTREDPQAAWEWMEQIENEELRESALSGIVNNWMLQDEQAAREWIDQADLSDDFKRQLLREPEAQDACRCKCPC